MVAPIRLTGSRTALGSGAAIQIGFNPRDIERVQKRFEQNMGAPLARRLQIATSKSADLFKRPIAAAAPYKTGALRRSVKVRQEKEKLGALVGPTARHAHLVIQGHRIVTPGGRYLGRSSQKNPFVSRAARPLKDKLVTFVKEAAFV